MVLEVGERVRAAAGSGLAVGLRLSIEERLANGAGITEEEFLRQLEVLDASGLFDFYDLSAGGYYAKHVSVTPMSSDLPAGFLAPAPPERARHCRAGRRSSWSAGLSTSGPPSTSSTPAPAGHGGDDRAQMADPHLVRKALESREQDIVRCVGANVCIRRLGENNHVACVMNPALGREAASGEGRCSVRAAASASR